MEEFEILSAAVRAQRPGEGDGSGVGFLYRRSAGWGVTGMGDFFELCVQGSDMFWHGGDLGCEFDDGAIVNVVGFVNLHAAGLYHKEVKVIGPFGYVFVDRVNLTVLDM